MSRQKGSANFAGTIEVQAGGPIDARTVVGTVADLTASSTFDYFYEGMQVYVKEDKKTYKLIGGNPTAAANWEEVGAGEEITIDSTPTSGSTNAVSSGGVYNSLGGKADLVDGKIPASQLPVGFDNYDEYNSRSAFPVTGESDKIYVARDTNLTYRWTGSNYVTIGGSDLALGETPSTAYRGDRGKIAYDDSQTNKASIGTLANLATAIKTNLVAAINEIKNSLTSVATSGSFNDLVNRPTKEVTSIASITPLPETPIKLLTIADKIDKANIYSTTEKIIGQWTDGRPIYQKTFSVTTPSSTTTGTTILASSNLSGVKDVVKMTMNYMNSNNALRVIEGSMATDGTATPDVPIIYVDASLNIKCFNPCSLDTSKSAKLTIQYTKTTDSAMPVGTDTDYSTSEKIVGSWVDGKPLYQKTINFGAGPNNTTKNVAHGISNIGRVCDIKVNMTKPTTSFAFPDVVLGSTLSLTQNVRCYVTGDNVIINSQQRDISDMDIIVTLQYTKTTD